MSVKRASTGGASLSRPPLARPRDCVLGGVSVAVARHLGWRVSVVRWLFVAFTFASGAGALLYAWIWALTPLEETVDSIAGPGITGPTPVRRKVPVAWGLFGVSALFAAAALVYGSGHRSGAIGGMLTATVLMVASAAASVAWDQLVDSRDPSRSRVASPTIRIACGALLVSMGLLLLISSNGSDDGWVWLLVILTTFAGAAVMLAPWALGLWRELLAERTVRVREEQRAEIAAHLHDSVLQTLALIQNRAGASSEVARLARAQERELRDWLYAGSRPAESDLTTQLRDFAATLEIDHPVRIEIVAVGEAVEQGISGVASAAREAMLNAARHAGGEVSVYIETTPAALDVFVRDRGTGFDLSRVPDHRLGVRESIIGRMKRSGGYAQVVPGSGGVGTEVRLHLDRETGETA